MPRHIPAVPMSADEVARQNATISQLCSEVEGIREDELEAATRRPYLGADIGGGHSYLDADHPRAQTLREAGDRAVQRLVDAIGGPDVLHADVHTLLDERRAVLREGDSVWIAYVSQADNRTWWGNRQAGVYWSRAALRSVAPRRSWHEALEQERRKAEADAWAQLVASTY